MTNIKQKPFFYMLSPLVILAPLYDLQNDYMTDKMTNAPQFSIQRCAVIVKMLVMRFYKCFPYFCNYFHFGA
jgi:hypothetical protein